MSHRQHCPIARPVALRRELRTTWWEALRTAIRARTDLPIFWTYSSLLRRLATPSIPAGCGSVHASGVPGCASSIQPVSGLPNGSKSSVILPPEGYYRPIASRTSALTTPLTTCFRARSDDRGEEQP
jgi:hypothetical protein